MDKVLVCVDFDHTLVDANTDVEIKSLANGITIPEEIEAMSKVSNGWTAYMREMFKFLFKNNVTKEDYVRCISSLQPMTGMKDLLYQMHESGDCELIIVSDANSFFIQEFLKHYQLDRIISAIFTNPAEFDEEGCLQIQEFHKSSCKRCPPNLCKGEILVNYNAKRLEEGTHFTRTLYIGDGRNDVCPAVRLGMNDYIFARAGHRLLRALEKMPARDVKAFVISWETGNDIRNYLLSL
ncbi:pyridoxal phosphate phosphatase PHOSPHO2 [Parasteatoda tepidariorum]|nr:pyridoxal phosphate phosphatase PHOSPHO2 [Parasteatoda tepidariorum]XP_015919665.1 pyridoxal phosphate phosphatase PHOSPHO2 [Parasteatoda tepidariorum]